MTTLAPKRIIRTIDPFALCKICKSDDYTEVVPAELGVHWKDCGCHSRVVICRECQAIASEQCPHGQELRSEFGKRGQSVSAPGQPTRRVLHDLSPSDVSRFLEPGRPRFDSLDISRRRH